MRNTKTARSEAASLMGRQSYRIRLERFGLARLQEIARQNGRERAADRGRSRNGRSDALPEREGAGKTLAVWWYKIKFQGQVIRESTKSNSKRLAKDAERAETPRARGGVQRHP